MRASRAELCLATSARMNGPAQRRPNSPTDAQHGHTGVAGRAPGYLDDPDGADLVPPDSPLVTHGPTMG